VNWFIGIDPGVDGAVVVLGSCGTMIAAGLLPTNRHGPKGRRLVDPVQLEDRLLPYRCKSIACVEDIVIMPKMGAASSASNGLNHGIIRAVLAMMAIPHEIVPPARWKKAVCPGGGDPKARAIAVAERMLPTLNLRPGKSRKPHDGLADAACLALHAFRLSSSR
jgi:Holliday junction resolvasome RuvABC endonuclease subunit